MTMRKAAKSEKRTLRQYLNEKLGMSVTAFAMASEISLRTLYDRWNSPEGKIHVMNSVHSFYVERFEGL